MAELNEQIVLDALKQIIDPDLRKDPLAAILDATGSGGIHGLQAHVPLCRVSNSMSLSCRR